MTSLPADTNLYDAYYYRHGCGEPYARKPIWLEMFAGMAGRIQKTIQPATVLDVGCAMGFLVEGLRDLGVEAFGIDVSEYALQQVRADVRPYCQLASITAPLARRYALVVCIEVVEHLPPAEGGPAVKNLCQAADDILFSSTPSDYGEPSHFNIQPPEYWAGLFAEQGFVRDVDFDASFIAPWAVRFRRTQEPASRLLQNYERKFWLVWQENQGLRRALLEMRSQLAKDEEKLLALQTAAAQAADSPAGQLAQVLAPRHSLRERVLTGIQQAWRRWMRPRHG